MRPIVLLSAPLLFLAGFFLWMSCGLLMMDRWGAFWRLMTLDALCVLGLYLVFRKRKGSDDERDW